MNNNGIVLKSSRPRFAWVVDGLSRGQCDVFDSPLYCDPASVAVPSMGSLIAGWMLVVPRKAAPSLAQLSREHRAELQAARTLVGGKIGAAFDGVVYEFEHGSGAFGGVMGCGVDQAHLHLVPLPFDLVETASVLAGEGWDFDAKTEDPWAEIPSGSDYWLIRNTKTGMGRVVIPEQAISQALRRLIAEGLGVSEWDYKTNPLPANATRTREAFCNLPSAR
jgi:diadenosine tetraphosphate (Ap4A) HIT family hydrolase